MVMQGTDMKVAETPAGGLEDFRVPDAYEDWLEKEKVLVHKTFYIPDMAGIEVGPWERKGGHGAIVHIDNALMPNDLHVVDIEPGGKSESEHHMYEVNFYIVSGRGRVRYHFGMNPNYFASISATLATSGLTVTILSPR